MKAHKRIGEVNRGDVIYKDANDTVGHEVLSTSISWSEYVTLMLSDGTAMGPWPKMMMVTVEKPDDLEADLLSMLDYIEKVEKHTGATILPKGLEITVKGVTYFTKAKSYVLWKQEVQTTTVERPER